jgi:chromosome segregation ATPase
MGTTHVTYVTNHYGITEEELHVILEKQKKKFDEIIEEIEKKKNVFQNDVYKQKIKINNLENEIKNLEKNKLEINDKKKENKELREKLAKTKKKLKVAVNSYKIAEQKNKELQKQLDLEKANSTEYLKKWIETKNELIEQKKENIKLKEQSAVKDEIIDFLEGELDKLTERCEEQKNEIELIKNNFLKEVEELKNIRIKTN